MTGDVDQVVVVSFFLNVKKKKSLQDRKFECDLHSSINKAGEEHLVAKTRNAYVTIVETPNKNIWLLSPVEIVV